MRIFFIQYLEQLIADKSNADTENEEQQCAYNHRNRFGFRVLKADDKCKHDNADYVVDDSGVKDKRADVPFKMPKLA